MNFLRQLYEHRHNAYEISIDDILDKPAKDEIKKYMDDKFGVSLETALDAIEGADKDFDNNDQTTIIQDAKNGIKPAIYYCFYRCYGKIISNYKMFMGSNPHLIAQRLAGEKDGKEAYIAYAYLALAGDFSNIRAAKKDAGTERTTRNIKSLVDNYIGLSNNALELYDFDKDKAIKPFTGLARIFEGCLQTIIRVCIPRENAGGINYDGEVTKAELTSGFSDKTASMVSIDKEINDEHSGAKTVGEKINSEVSGYESVEDSVLKKEEGSLLSSWIDFCTMDSDLYQISKELKSGTKVISAFDDFTDKKRPIFPCDVLKAYIKAIGANKGAASQGHVNDELKKILGLSSLQPMQWKATGHNAGVESMPNEIMVKAIKNYGFTPVQLATLISTYGADKLIGYIDDQLEDED